MKRYLLFCLMCVCVSIGALAQQSTMEEKFWYGNPDGSINEKVAVVNNQPGGLAAVMANIANDVTMLRVKGELSAEDVQALEQASFTTIDLQDAYYMENGDKKAFVFGNSTVRNLILPDNWSKKEVNALADHMPALGSAVSFGTQDFIANGQTKQSPSIVAYVKTGNTLYDALKHSYYEGVDNEKVGKIGRYNYSMHELKSVVISGYPVARDYSGSGQSVSTIKFDENGHFVFNEAPQEVGNQVRELVGTPTDGYYLGALTEPRQLVSFDISGAVVTEDDLTLSYTGAIGTTTKEVVIPTDPRVTTLPADFLNCESGVRQICIPYNIQVIRSRALCRNINHIWTNNPHVDAEGNPIEDGVCYDNGYFKTVKNEKGWNIEETQGFGQLPFDDNEFTYGTYTFSSNLKLIESYAFRYQVSGGGGATSHLPHVKDVYNLAEIAPECHIDAFHSSMYYGNNTINASVAIQKDGIITRDAYCVNPGSDEWISILHYPNTTVTPSIQHYIDPTRNYSVASTMIDGRGSTVYFPTQTEMIRSYEQAVTGYVWNAWDPTRTNDGSLGFANSGIDNTLTISHWTAENQALANNAWINNSSKTNKTYTSYYDVTGGGNSQPTGLEYYYNVYWNEKELASSGTPEQQLYPAIEMSAPYNKYIPVDDPESEEDLYVYRNGNYEPYSGAIDPSVTYYTTVKTQDKNSDGSLKYSECDNGTFVPYTGYQPNATGGFVKDLEITEASDGDYVKEYSWVSAENGDGDYVRKFMQDNNGAYYKVYAYEKNDEGSWCHAPWDGSWTTYQSWMGDIDRFDRILNGIELVPEGVYTIDGTLRGNLGNYEPTNGYTGEGLFYNKEYTVPVNYITYDSERDLADEPRYNIVDNGYRTFNQETDEGLQRYAEVTLYREAAEGETGTHCPVMVAAEFQDVLKQNDYRGWHQFILGAYSENTKLVDVPLKSYITDSDWWTICLPYDLRYSDMMALFGGSENEVPKIPYLSKLLYVVRDVENSHITLMFSKNLMVYKEHEPNSKNTINGTGHVHGVIDDLEWGDEIATNPVILHAGVPYVIKPWIPSSSNRQFVIYKQQQNSAALDAVVDGKINNSNDGIVRIKDDVLYNAMAAARTRSGDDSKELIYKGMYEVPAYLINNAAGVESPIDERTLSMKDGSEFTYKANPEFNFYGKNYEMHISSDFTYTFVGSFYKSIIPQYAYFLGWDKKLGKAAFWYNRKLDKSQWAWNNETGVICANWPKDQKISTATSISSPARWVKTSTEVKDGKTTYPAEATAEPVQISNDDFGQASSSQPAGVRAGSTSMLFGNSMLVSNEDGIEDVVSEGDGVPDAISGVNADRTSGKWYNVNGQRMNGVPAQSGVYIMNGKKYVVR